MSTPPLSTSRSLRKAIGPGILVAGAAVGGSHIVSSTQAGGDFGWSLVPMLILVNLFKYPFFLYSQRYTLATGETIVHAYRRMGPAHLNTFLLFTFFNGAWSIGGVALITGSLLTFLPFLSGTNPVLLMSVVTFVCIGIAMAGRYRALDKTAKTVVSLLALSTVTAVVLALTGGHGQSPEVEVSPYQMATFGFVIVFMGWMPAPIDISVWASLYTRPRERQTSHKISMREAMFDFHLGYIITVVLAFFFLALGALVLYGTPMETPFREMTGLGFAETFIGLYASAIGDWAKYLVWIAAVTCMFSTTLTCIDGWPRNVAFAIHLQTGQGKTDPEASYTKLHNLCIVVVVAIAIALVLGFFYGGLLPFYLATAMTTAFLTTPFFAYLNFRAIRMVHVPEHYRPGPLLNILSWAGMAFFLIFTVLFIIWYAIN